MSSKIDKFRLILAFLLAVLAGQALAQVDGPFTASGSGGAVVDPFGDCVLSPGGTNINACQPEVASVPTPAPLPPPAPVAPVTPPPAPSGPVFISLGADANFDFDRSELRPEGRESLNQLVRQMQTPGLRVSAVEIVGHTDSIGTEAYNQALSERRARSAAEYLVSRGVPSSVVTTEGRGELQPIATNTTDAGRARNRRVDITVDATRAQ